MKNSACKQILTGEEHSYGTFFSNSVVVDVILFYYFQMRTIHSMSEETIEIYTVWKGENDRKQSILVLRSSWIQYCGLQC